MEENYFDFIGAGEESCLFPLMGLILSPVLFPLYLSLKILTGLIEFLEDVISSVVEDIKKGKSDNNPEIKIDNEEIKNPKLEEIEKKVSELKAEKKKIEQQIKQYENAARVQTNVVEEVETCEKTNEGEQLTLKL